MSSKESESVAVELWDEFLEKNGLSVGERYPFYIVKEAFEAGQKANDERIFAKTGDEWAFIISNFDDSPLRKEIVRFLKELEEEIEGGK